MFVKSERLWVSALFWKGSVRRAPAIGVRLNVQLIYADTDEHLWAEDYDRELTDVFAIQTDLAQKIARSAPGQALARGKIADRAQAH